MDSINSVVLHNVEVQENGIIRNSKGRIIGRLVDDVEYKGEHVVGNVKKENKSIRIPVSTNDAEELREGSTFEWSFPVEGSVSSEWIDVELVGTDEEVM